MPHAGDDCGTPADAGFKVWDGVYGSFVEAPASGPGFARSAWEERSLQAVKAALAQVDAGESLDYSLTQRNAVLPVLVASLLSFRPRATILDFGGGPGAGFVVLAAQMKNRIAQVDYNIVELDRICRAGALLFANRPGPVFHRRLPAEGPFDIVYSSSVIQYIDNWRGKIEELAAIGSRFLVFSDAFVGEAATFATLQNYFGSKIPHWLFNLREFVAAVECRGYVLTLRCACPARILGRHGPLPMEHFPAALRISASSHLVFQHGATM